MKKTYRVFIDGKVGSTGLLIEKRIAKHDGVSLIEIADSQRKNLEARIDCIKRADLSFLCLPDAASLELIQKLDPLANKIIDASTAHRLDPSWTYGLPELRAGQREKIG